MLSLVRKRSPGASTSSHSAGRAVFPARAPSMWSLDVGQSDSRWDDSITRYYLVVPSVVSRLTRQAAVVTLVNRDVLDPGLADDFDAALHRRCPRVEPGSRRVSE